MARVSKLKKDPLFKNKINNYLEGRQKNSAFTANRTDPYTGQQYTATRRGMLSADGGKTANGLTNTFSYYDENGVRKSGRGGKIQTRATRRRDVITGFNAMTPTVARAMLDAGQMTQNEYDRMFAPGGTAQYGSLGLSAG